ncbi:MAG: hypothetical protein GXP15_01900 [Gammaproteobacteria bacterium]|nr:hypothetical protein [Gammaproteobacteria bacterium]
MDNEPVSSTENGVFQNVAGWAIGAVVFIVFFLGAKYLVQNGTSFARQTTAEYEADSLVSEMADQFEEAESIDDVLSITNSVEPTSLPKPLSADQLGQVVKITNQKLSGTSIGNTTVQAIRVLKVADSLGIEYVYRDPSDYSEWLDLRKTEGPDLADGLLRQAFISTMNWCNQVPINKFHQIRYRYTYTGRDDFILDFPPGWCGSVAQLEMAILYDELGLGETIDTSAPF